MFVDGCYKVVTILTLTLFCLLSAHYANCLSKERENRHLFPLLGYLHGYKIGQNFALQLPPFVLSPVVIVPSVNQQQSVNIQKSNKGENYHETGGTFQIISPAKLISNITEISNEDNTIYDTDFKQTFKSDLEKDFLIKNNESSNEHDSFRQIITNDTDAAVTTKTTEIDTATPTMTTDAIDNEVEYLKSTTQLRGPYPTVVYKNENLSTLSITTAPLQINSTSPTALLQYNLTLPNSETNFQNFSIKYPNVYENNKTLDSNDRQSNFKAENINIQPTTEFPSILKGYPYPNPWYNAMVDKLSITTNPYTNNESPLPSVYDDRWQSFSSLRKPYPASDFRPLAGLYHDGFLHKSLIKRTGFIPINSKYLYYN